MDPLTTVAVCLCGALALFFLGVLMLILFK
jgi:hypothetical protein